ncbi:hypothetical protein GJ744_006375 [Endocarpon pusillum]|uniref:Protein kinase domain-containing protein n=1 Tax=Endocarpon pusillum TaxID=364733 RepID=A0A8H7ANA5_9EURO|nr:hypothetical protein GJ744_006375 [Endocarpon pusillum]
MKLSIGQILRGRNATYRLLNALCAPTVSKAQVVDGNTMKPEFVVVKTALEDDVTIALRRERNVYLIPGIRSSPYIRSQLDILASDEDRNRSQPKVEDLDTAPPGMVFEWMEYDLWHVPSERFRHNSILPKVISRSILSALALLKTEYDAIHTDVDSPSPLVKVGDLGNVIGGGYDKMRLQSFECRAPEVWRGLGVWHSSDVWSFGVTLAHWLSHSTIFGPRDKFIGGMTEAWCIAKIRRLVGPIGPPVNLDYQLEFKMAKFLEMTSVELEGAESPRHYITVGTLRQELEKIPDPKVDPELLDFIEFLLVLDHTKRPTAVEALQHPYLCLDSVAGTSSKSIDAE